MNNIELWSGFFGTIFGAIIGGYIAYLIARFQFKSQEKNNKADRENQLLWQVYLDIRKDFESSKLLEKYDELIHKQLKIRGTPYAEYINFNIHHLIKNLNTLLRLLESKGNEKNNDIISDSEILWERSGQLLILLYSLYEKFKKIDLDDNIEIEKNYNIASEVYLRYCERELRK